MVGLTGHRAQDVLDQEGNAAERAIREVRRGRGRPGLVERRMNHGIQLGIELLDAHDGGIDQFEGGYLAGSNELRLSGRVQ